MKKAILRNIAIISAIFIVSFSIMLITNHFQVRNSTPLETEIMTTLMEINNQNANNPELQAQIRQLDLLARQAYFGNQHSLMAGVYILLAMLAVFILCTRLYFAKDKNIPDKEIDPIDEWAIKTKARKYVIWGTAGLAAIALLFVTMTSPYLKAQRDAKESLNNEISAEVQNYQGSEDIAFDAANAAYDPDEAINEDDEANENDEAADIPEAPRITHNAFRGNNGTGVSSARGLPTRWNLSTRQNIAWRTEIPRPGMSSPVINGNRVFITAGDDTARELYAYDLNTGTLLWTLAAPSNNQGISANDFYYPPMWAASTPATNGNQVVAIFPTGDIIAADMDGNQLWTRNLGVPDNHYGYASSLLIFGNLVIVQYDNHNDPRVMALDIATGAERWSTARTERVRTTWSSPIMAFVDGTPQLVLMGNPNITAYNPNNGQQLWQVGGLSGEVGSSATSANGIIFAASEYARMVAINGATGEVMWENRDFLPDISSPVATRDNVFLAVGYGVVANFSAQTGELRTEHDFRGSFYSSPMLAEGRIYLFDTDGKAYIFAANDAFTLLDSFETGEKTYASPAFTDGRIIVRTDNSIYMVMAN
ncbi:MAG: PQQ-binding-like beta-propeller repeat protein [Dysgonamonadaceae bacterium]|jgi:outer membrane protein assembly factor BamB|nr:PQQ-binding-like beta-propeller repeat protein [Dysgonamonadaceae bacterium]